MSLVLHEHSSEEELVRYLRHLFTPERLALVDEELLHREWRALESWLSDRMVGMPSWDYSLMDWPVEIPLFDLAINNQALQPNFTLEELQSLLALQTLPWVVRIEWMDRIQEGVMSGGSKLKDCLVQRDRVDVWQV